MGKGKGEGEGKLLISEVGERIYIGFIIIIFISFIFDNVHVI